MKGAEAVVDRWWQRDGVGELMMGTVTAVATMMVGRRR